MAVHFLKKGVGRIKKENAGSKQGTGAGRRCLSFLLAFAMVFSVAAVGLTGPAKAAEDSATLRFNKNGEFKILQITDFQDVASNNGYNDETLNLLNAAIRFSKPDLVVFTGDQLNDPKDLEDARSAISVLTNPVISAGIPFAVVFGNHDYADKASKKQQMEYYMSLPGCVALENDPDYDGNTNDGRGNYYLPVQSSDGTKDAFNLWFFDSLSSGGDRNDHVTQAQIDWFEKKNAALGRDVPGIVFQHICVPEIYQLLDGPLSGVTKDNVNSSAYPEAALCENNNQFYVKKSTTSGMLGEGPCPNGYSDFSAGSDQYRSWVAQGNIQGAFFGHDHLNDIVGKTNDGIVLSQCKTIGSGDNYNNDSSATDTGRVPSQALRDQLAGTNGYRTITIYEDPTDKDVIAGTNFKTESFYEKDVIHERYLDLARLEKALTLTPQKAQAYYTEDSWNHFTQTMAEQTKAAAEADFKAWEEFSEDRQNQANEIAASIEAAYNALAAKPAQGDFDAGAAPTILSPELIRVGAADNSLNKMEYGNTIQTGEINYLNKTWVDTVEDRKIKFYKAGASNVRLTGPGGVTLSGPATETLAGSPYQVWTITGGTATAGETLCFTIQYTYQEREYQTKVYVYVDTIINPSGWYTFTRSYYPLNYDSSLESVHVSTVTGQGVYAANGKGYYRYGAPYNTWPTDSDYYQDTDHSYIGEKDTNFSPNGTLDAPAAAASSGRFYGMRPWSPKNGRLGWWTQGAGNSGRDEGEMGTENGERAASNVYVDTSVIKDIGDLDLSLTFWNPAEFNRNYGRNRANLVLAGLLIKNTTNESDYRYGDFNGLPAQNDFGWGVKGNVWNHTLLSTAAHQNEVLAFTGQVPANGTQVTLVSKWHESDDVTNIGTWLPKWTVWNRTFNGYTLNFHTFDKGPLREMLEAERGANRQEASYLENGRVHDTSSGAFGRYEAALEEAYRQLYKPDTDQSSIDSALTELKKWTLYDPAEENYADGDMIRKFVLELQAPANDQIEVRYSLSSPQTQGSWNLAPVVYSVLDDYSAAKIQLTGSGENGAFVLTNEKEADVSFQVIDNGTQRQPGDFIGGAEGIAKGSYEEYSFGVNMLADDETPAGTYEGQLIFTFTNPPTDGSYPSNTPIVVMTVNVVLVVEEGYIITIPSDTNIPFFAEHTLLGGSMEGLTAKVQIPTSEHVSLSVSSKNEDKLVSVNSDYVIPYQLDEQTQTVDGEGNLQFAYDAFTGATYSMATPFTKTALAASITPEAWGAVPIDTYNDVLTFTATYSGSANAAPALMSVRNEGAAFEAAAPAVPALGAMMRPSILNSAQATVDKESPSSVQQKPVSGPNTHTTSETAVPTAPVTTATAPLAPATTAAPTTTAPATVAPVTTTEPSTAAPDTEPSSQKETAAIPPAPSLSDPKESAEPVS